MILQSLTAYYGKLREDKGRDVPPPGFSREKIHFALMINADGHLVSPMVLDLREVEGKKSTRKK